MDLSLTDKIAIVTGSSRGLGLASARALVTEGCRVCICARGSEQLAAAALAVEAAARRPNMVIAVQADVSTPDGIALVVDRTVEAFGGLDILVNNVGRAAGSDLLDTSDAEWQAAIDETLFPAIRASRLAVPHMKQRGGGVDHHDRLDLGPRVRRPHDLQRRQGRRDQPRQGARAAARAGQHPREQRRPGLDPVSRRVVAQAAAGGSRPASRSSSSASCRSGASAVPTKSAPSSPSSRRRRRAG